jgi:large subunit ribosomal protein L25
MSKIELNAENRSDLGKGASRRLRHAGKVPAVVYGTGEPISIQLLHKDLWKAQEAEAFYSSVLNLNIDGKATDVIVKDMQRHPAKRQVLHLDFQRIDAKAEIIVNVPLHFINGDICPGVKMQGGSVQYVASLLQVSCLPGNLPEYIEVDLKDAQSGDIIHISDVTLPEGITSVELSRGADHDHPVAQINAPRGAAVDQDSDADADADESAE